MSKISSKNTSIKQNVVLNSFRMSLTVLVPLITFPYTSRIFHTEGTGQLNFASSVTQIFAIFASLGIYSYGVREGTKVRKNRKEFSHFAQELLLLNAVSTVIAYCFFLICLYFIPSFQSHLVLLLIYSVTIPFTALGLDWVYGTYEEYRYITIRQIIVQIFTIGTMFVFVHEESDIVLWAALSAFSSVGANIFNIFHARKYVSFKPQGNYKIKRHIPHVMTLFATQLSSKVYNNLDTVLLGIFCTDYHTGIYSAAVKINTILITMFSAMSPVYIPRIVEKLQASDIEGYKSLVKKIFRLVFALGIPCVIGLEMTRDMIIYVIAGEEFEASSITLGWLAPVVLVSALSNVLYYDILVPIQKESNVLTCTAASSLINLGLSLVLVNLFQENGVAIGSLIAEICGMILALRYAFKSGRIDKTCFPDIIPYCSGALVIVFICTICDFLLQGYLMIHLICAVFFSIVGYLVVLLAFRDTLTLDGIKFFLSIFHSRKNSK